MRILVVEDDPRMADLLRQGLTEEGHSVTLAGNGVDALSLASGAPFDAMILDVMLPGLDGFTVARRIRESNNHLPILLLTARDATHDIVTGLDQGADDYLTKPFSFDVLLARLRALCRRSPVAHPVILRAGNLELDAASHEARRGGRPINLTRTEFSILELLIRNTGRVVTRDSLIGQVWGHNAEIENNTLDAFVRLVRAKVEPPGEPKLLHTVRGIGYCLKPGEPG
jgi:DNA-binding response OmpR family regulator